LIEKHGFKLAEFCDTYTENENLPFKESNRIKNSVMKKWCKRLGLSYPGGCAVHCTCEYDKEWIKFLESNSHANDCPIIRDNFHYKPTGFSIQWYKYILRDAYKSQDISLGKFTKIIDKCIKSLKEDKK
jgi:hypothetical protein